MRRAPVYTPAGLYLGDAPTYDVDLDRLGKVTNRIVRGLFYSEFHRPLPETYGVRSYAESGFRHLTFDQRGILNEVTRTLSSTPPRVIGDRVFEYRFRSVPEDVNTTGWLLRFFESELFFCVSAQNHGTPPAA